MATSKDYASIIPDDDYKPQRYYINIAKDDGSIMEVELELNGTLMLSTVRGQFPSAIGLKHRLPNGIWRGLRMANNVLHAPQDGWCERTYVVSLPDGMENISMGLAHFDIGMEDVDSNMKIYNLNDADVLLHFNIFNGSEFSFHRLVKTGKLKEIISQRETIMEEFTCMRKSGRSVDKSSLLLCAGIHYIFHEEKRYLLADKINDICETPTDLFKLINIISNEDNIKTNFREFDDFSQFKLMMKNNILKQKPKRDRSSRKRKMKVNTAGCLANIIPTKRYKGNAVDDISKQISEAKLDGDNSNASLTEGEKNKITAFIKKHPFIECWYLDPKKTAVDLLYMLTKYTRRCGWDHKIILHHAHFIFKSKGYLSKPRAGIQASENDDDMEGIENQIGIDPNQQHRQQQQRQERPQHDPSWDGGDCNLVINYILHGMTNIMKVERFQNYFTGCPNNEAKNLAVDEVTSKALGAIYCLEKCKLKDGESWKDPEKVNQVSLRVADLIMKYRRIEEYPCTTSMCYDTSVFMTADEDDDDHGVFVLPDGDVPFSPSGHTSFSSDDKTDDETGCKIKLRRFHLCIEHLPTPLTKLPMIWEVLMKDMPITAFISHICYIAGLQLFNTENQNVRELLKVLQVPTRLRRVNPFQLLKAIMEYRKVGIRRNVKKGRKWNVLDIIYNALCEAFCNSLKYCPRGVNRTFSNLKYKICIESSKSMMTSGFIGNPKLSGTRAAIAMAHAIQKFCSNTDIDICGEKVYKPGERVGMKEEKKDHEERKDWHEDKKKKKKNKKKKRFDLKNEDELFDMSDTSDLITRLYSIQLVTPNIRKGILQQQRYYQEISRPRKKEDRSNLAAPITLARESRELVDAFILFTTSVRSELIGESPYDEFLHYQREIKPNAKLIICAMEVNSQVIADPNDPNVKVLCGVDAYLLHEIIRFMNADQNTERVLCKFCCSEHGR